MANIIPIGCRFRPTEEELISLLWLKVTNQLQETDDVKEMTLYGEGASPWQVFGDHNDIHWQIFDENGKKANTKKMAYVFTKLTKLSDKRTARTAGLGTWDGETKKTPVENLFTRDQIGSRRMLSYVLNSGSEAVKGGWIMHEYSLDGTMLDGINSSHNTDYVICRIIRDDSKFTKVKASATKKGKVVEEEKAENGGRPQVLGKRMANHVQENSQTRKMIPRNNIAEAPTDEAVNPVVIATDGDRPMELPIYLVNYGGTQPMSALERDGYGWVQSTTFLSESLQKGAPSSYNIGNYWLPSNNGGMENSEIAGNSGSGASVNQVTTCENLDSLQQSFEVQSREQKYSSSVDCGEQMKTYQADQVVSNDFVDPVSWENILQSIECGNENIIEQLPLPSDEWFQGAQPHS